MVKLSDKEQQFHLLANFPDQEQTIYDHAVRTPTHNTEYTVPSVGTPSKELIKDYNLEVMLCFSHVWLAAWVGVPLGNPHQWAQDPATHGILRLSPSCYWREPRRGGAKLGRRLASALACTTYRPGQVTFFLLFARRLADDEAHQFGNLGQWEFFPSDVDLLANGNLSKLQMGSAQAFGSEREVRTSNAPLISPANESNSRYEDFMMTAMRSEMMEKHRVVFVPS